VKRMVKEFWMNLYRVTQAGGGHLLVRRSISGEIRRSQTRLVQITVCLCRSVLRLCRLLCGKASPFRQPTIPPSPVFFWREG